MYCEKCHAGCRQCLDKYLALGLTSTISSMFDKSGLGKHVKARQNKIGGYQFTKALKDLKWQRDLEVTDVANSEKKHWLKRLFKWEIDSIVNE